MKLVNANIKTKEETLKRMIDGEVFYYNIRVEACEIYFDLDCINEEYPPFRVKEIGSGHIEPLRYFLKKFSEFKMEKKWYENITESVQCWVSNSSPTEKEYIDFIDDKDGNHFIATSKVYWKYATPLTKEDLLGE